MHLAQITGINSPSNRFGNYNTLLGDFVTRLLLFAIVAAGLVFFVKLLTAGFSYLTSTGDPAKIQSATKNLTNAAIGLIVVITTYFLIQIIEVVFGLTIL